MDEEIEVVDDFKFLCIIIKKHIKDIMRSKNILGYFYIYNYINKNIFHLIFFKNSHLNPN